MTKIKRMCSLILAMNILVSFFLTQVIATPSYREFDSPDHVVNFFDGDPVDDSYARVFCTDYGWNEEVYTDFEATTYAYNIHYHYGVEMVYVMRANVYVELYYPDEGHSIDMVAEAIIPSRQEFGGAAVIDGNSLIDSEHGIGDFVTEHWIEICQINFGQFGDEGLYVAVADHGSTISIGRTENADYNKIYSDSSSEK